MAGKKAPDRGVIRHVNNLSAGYSRPSLFVALHYAAAAETSKVAAASHSASPPRRLPRAPAFNSNGWWRAISDCLADLCALASARIGGQSQHDGLRTRSVPLDLRPFTFEDQLRSRRIMEL